MRALIVIMACSLLGLDGLAAAVPAVPSAATQRGPVVSTVAVKMADGRMVDVERITPVEAPRGLIVFSHGANSAPQRYRRLTIAWAEAGYVVMSPVHLDSEEHPQRVSDNRARVLATRLEDWQATASEVRGLADPGADFSGLPLFAAGHSYGAYIAQIAGGARVIDPGSGKPIRLPFPQQLRAIVALSPPPAFEGFSPPGSWRTVSVPMLVQTGSLDVMPPFVTRWQQHLDSHNDAPPGLSYQAVYRDVDHYFGGLIGRIREHPDVQIEHQFQRFVALSIRFMDQAGSAALEGFSTTVALYSDTLDSAAGP